MANEVSRRSIIYDILVDFKDGKKSITDAEKAVSDLSKTMNGAATGIEKFSNNTLNSVARLKQLKNQLNNFKGSEKEFEKLTLEAAKLQNQIENTNRRIRTLASSTRSLQAFASGIQGITGLFTAAQGAAALFGNENQNLQKSILRVQGALALLQGVQAAVATVTEQSAFKTVVLTNAQKAYNFVVGTSTGLMKGFKIALASSGIGLAVIAVLELVSAFKNLNKEQEQTIKNEEELAKLRKENIEAAMGAIRPLKDISTKELTKQLNDLQKQIDEVSIMDFALSVAGDTESSTERMGKFVNDTKRQIKEITDELDKRKDKNVPKKVEEEVTGFLGMEDTPQIEKERDIFLQAEEDKAKAMKEVIDIMEGRQALIFETAEVEETAWDAEKRRAKERKLLQEQELALRKAILDSTLASASQTFGALSSLAAQGSEAQIAFAEIQILANTAQALSAAITAATEAAAQTGGSTLPFLIPSFVGIALSAIAQSNALLSQAKAKNAPKPNATSFAEGTPYLERGDNPKGVDTIPIMANEGERIVSTEDNLKHWDIYEAIRNNNLEEFIKQNYVAPELVIKGLEHADNDSTTLDYSTRFYRQLIETKTGNQLHKAAIRALNSIDRKLNKSIPERYT